MKHLVLRGVAAIAFASFLQPAIATDHSSPAAPAAKSASQPLSEGTVRKLDKAAGSITLNHGPIENLGMGAMTMTFTLKKGVVPASVKEGDKVKAGQVIASVETDKVSNDLESPVDGTVSKLMFKAGTEGIKVDEVLCVIEEGK